MASHGKNFEDNLVSALEDWVGDEGVVLIRRQSFSMRGGNFQGSQETDILVDSAKDEYYIGLEAKSRNSETKPGMYFSSDIDVEQFQDQIQYRRKSGRDIAVAVEIRNCDSCDCDCAWLVPLELFTESEERELKKVSWPDIHKFGYSIGSNGDLEFERRGFDAVNVRGPRMKALLSYVYDYPKQ